MFVKHINVFPLMFIASEPISPRGMSVADAGPGVSLINASRATCALTAIKLNLNGLHVRLGIGIGVVAVL
jgi:hypothetical protein